MRIKPYFVRYCRKTECCAGGAKWGKGWAVCRRACEIFCGVSALEKAAKGRRGLACVGSAVG